MVVVVAGIAAVAIAAGGIAGGYVAAAVQAALELRCHRTSLVNPVPHLAFVALGKIATFAIGELAFACIVEILPEIPGRLTQSSSSSFCSRLHWNCSGWHGNQVH